jgi:hypothetical protein
MVEAGVLSSASTYFLLDYVKWWYFPKNIRFDFCLFAKFSIFVGILT